MHAERHLERRETLAYWPVRNTDTGEAVGLVTDLSEEGVRIHSEHNFVSGYKFTMRITVASELAGTDHISFQVENVWCSRSGISGLYNAGFKIVEMSDRARNSLRALLQAFSYPAPSQAHGAEQSP